MWGISYKISFFFMFVIMGLIKRKINLIMFGFLVKGKIKSSRVVYREKFDDFKFILYWFLLEVIDGVFFGLGYCG